MERTERVRHHRDHMQRRVVPTTAWAAALGTFAVIGIAIELAIDASTRTTLVISGTLLVLAYAAGAAGALLGGRSWPARRPIGIALALTSLSLAGYLIVATARPMGGADPSYLDVVFLAVLVPFGFALRAEFVAHFDPRGRREIAADVALVALAIAALLYIAIRPVGADGPASVSAVVFALIAAAVFAGFAALATWVPTVGHLLLFLAYVPLALGLIGFGRTWVQGMFDGNSPLTDVGLFVTPLAIAATMLIVDHRAERQRPASRFARPVLSVAAIMAATGAMIVISIVDDRQGIAGPQSSAILAILGLAMVARVLVSQRSAAADHVAVQAALEERGNALDQTDRALARLRETNETLRRSEEHLRLVFEAAVDGFVELRPDGTIERANDAFCAMVGRDRSSIEGAAWDALASLTPGGDPAFADLPHGGTATISRADGQPLHVEARVSKVPTDPPRTLMLVRDITAAKVADQTIRSLFQFLQDRDEDRTRLLRRTNAAIEHERNRIARDLHDGPVQGVSAATLSLEAALLMLRAGDVEGGTTLLIKIREELSGEAEALRRLMSNLRPPVLEERGLMPALRESLIRFEDETGITAVFSGSVVQTLPDDLETLAYRVVQEALTNVGRHAGAAEVRVHLAADGEQVRIEIEDDGEGFDPGQARDYLKTGRVGLASMRERVELASGTFAIRSNPGRGTAVMATIPLDGALAGSAG
jgi:signal transduction histidine kinase